MVGANPGWIVMPTEHRDTRAVTSLRRHRLSLPTIVAARTSARRRTYFGGGGIAEEW
jgi:hypothetical protein